jgi:hypothetical protein
MRKVFVSCILLVVGFVVAGNFSQSKAPGDKPQTPYFIMQESGSVPGSIAKAYTGADSLWQVKDQRGISTYAKGYRVISKADSGLIYFHLLDNPAGVYDKYFVRPGDRMGVIFDKIYKTGGTMNLDSVSILL